MPQQPPATERNEYELIGALAPTRAHLRFNGRFGDREVVWDAILVTLAETCRERMAAAGLPAGTVLEVRPYIEIPAAPEGSAPCPIRIGLAVETLDRPTLLKTVIMIRQYKRLAVGRHEFGEPQRFPVP